MRNTDNPEHTGEIDGELRNTDDPEHTGEMDGELVLGRGHTILTSRELM